MADVKAPGIAVKLKAHIDSDDDDGYEYHETTSEMDQGDAVPPKGSGWEWMGKLKFGSIVVHRWRRLKP